MRAVFGVDACCVFPQNKLAVIALIGAVIDWCYGDESLNWMLGKVSSSFCGCHRSVGVRVGSPVGMEAPRSGSKLQCGVSGTGVPL